MIQTKNKEKKNKDNLMNSDSKEKINIDIEIIKKIIEKIIKRFFLIIIYFSFILVIILFLDF